MLLEYKILLGFSRVELRHRPGPVWIDWIGVQTQCVAYVSVRWFHSMFQFLLYSSKRFDMIFRPSIWDEVYAHQWSFSSTFNFGVQFFEHLSQWCYSFGKAWDGWIDTVFTVNVLQNLWSCEGLACIYKSIIILRIQSYYFRIIIHSKTCGYAFLFLYYVFRLPLVLHKCICQRWDFTLKFFEFVHLLISQFIFDLLQMVVMVEPDRFEYWPSQQYFIHLLVDDEKLDCM